MKPAYEYMSDIGQKAYAQGKAELLLKLLQLKFGPLPESAVDRVQSAETELLDRWAEHVLTAESLDDVLSR